MHSGESQKYATDEMNGNEGEAFGHVILGCSRT